jgi:hypothetical protein
VGHVQGGASGNERHIGAYLLLLGNLLSR